jgi:hypothetical protein
MMAMNLCPFGVFGNHRVCSLRPLVKEVFCGLCALAKSLKTLSLPILYVFILIVFNIDIKESIEYRWKSMVERYVDGMGWEGLAATTAETS